jgi:DNA-binding NtrC family response regulator
VVNGGTIFLDEVAELPLSTQVRLLRILESGEFFKVGSSKVIKTDVRLVAASNINIPEAIRSGKFRQDLYYRLNTVPIFIPALRERKEDIYLLFRKFASDFAERYRMPVIQLDQEAQRLLNEYRWPGNIRQLKNITEQISIIEENRNVSAGVLRRYLPSGLLNELPVLYKKEGEDKEFSDRDLLYKVLFDMKKDIHDLKKVVSDITADSVATPDLKNRESVLIKPLDDEMDGLHKMRDKIEIHHSSEIEHFEEPIHASEIVEEPLSLQEKEIDMIRKALQRHNGKRKNAAKELGISERTLYRKIKEFNIE